jgi:hypothetical protein
MQFKRIRLSAAVAGAAVDAVDQAPTTTSSSPQVPVVPAASAGPVGGDLARQWGHPFDRPLDVEPDTSAVEAGEMLRVALLHVGVIAGWDTRISRWLSGKDTGTIASIASWLRRAWKEGHTAGRVEAVEESGEIREPLARTREQLAGLSAEVGSISAYLAEAATLAGEADDLPPATERLLSAVTAAVTDLADAVEHLSDPPACGGCEHPNCPTTPLVLCSRSAVDMALVAAEGDSQVAVAGRWLAELDAAIARLAAEADCRRCPADVLAARVADRIAADATLDEVRGHSAGDRWSGAYPLPAWWDGTGDAETSCAARGWDDLTGLVQLCLRPDGHAGRHMAALTTVFAGRPPEIICAWPGTALPAESDLTDPCIDALRGYGAGGDDDHADPHFTRGRCVCTCDRCVTRMAVPGEDDAPVCTCPDGCTCDDGIHPGANTPEDQGDDVLQPGHAIPDQPGYVVGTCGHRVAGSEWSAGYRTCERCPADDGHSTPLAAAGPAAGALGVAGLVATHSDSPGLGIVFAAVGGIAGVAVLVLGRRGPGGGAS